MKKLIIAIMGVFTLVFTSCSSSDDEPKMKNATEFVSEGKTLYDNDTEGVALTLNLASAVEDNVTIGLSLTGDDASAFELSPASLTIAKGTKSATFVIKAKSTAMLTKNETLTVGISSSSDDNLITTATATVNAAPALTVANLTDDQLKLIAGYKEKYGIDIRPMLGLLDVKTTVTFNTEDKSTYNDGKDTRTLTGQTAITLSDNATAEKIVLKMTGNPMGMTDFMYTMLKKSTTEDVWSAWGADPINAAIMAAYPLTGKETFDVTLDNITVDPTTKKISFVGATTDAYGSQIQAVPFVFAYSAYERLKTEAANGAKIQVGEGETTAEYSLKELIGTYSTLNPKAYLTYSDISADNYKYTPSNWIAASAVFNLDDKTMSFDFPWDFYGLYDYLKINVNYTLASKE
jgi:hypothetical protein